MATKGIDSAARISESKAAELAALGIGFVGRYLVPAVGSLTWKALSAAEASALRAAGLDLLLIWEIGADRALGGTQAGQSDGARAAQLARAMDVPEGTGIYYAVDFDAQPAQLPAVEAYLRAAAKASAPYAAGVYGSYRVIEAMHAAGACALYWQCVGWSGGKVSVHADVYQSDWGKTAAGLNVDLNEAYSGAGLWEAEMTQEKFNTMADAWLASLAERPEPDWSREEGAWKKATEAGLVNGRAPEGLLKRDEAAALLARSGVIK